MKQMGYKCIKIKVNYLYKNKIYPEALNHGLQIIKRQTSKISEGKKC